MLPERMRVEREAARDVVVPRFQECAVAINAREDVTTTRVRCVGGEATLRRVFENLLASYDVVPSRLVVIEPGTDPAPVARGSDGSPLRMLTVATLNPGKGHDSLIRALAALEVWIWRSR